MSDDLISRKSIIDILESIRLNDRNLVRRYAAADIEERVKKLPTAYDIDAVCEEINNPNNYTIIAGKRYTTIERANEIVRNGGKKE